MSNQEPHKPEEVVWFLCCRILIERNFACSHERYNRPQKLIKNKISVVEYLLEVGE